MSLTTMIVITVIYGFGAIAALVAFLPLVLLTVVGIVCMWLRWFANPQQRQSR